MTRESPSPTDPGDEHELSTDIKSTPETERNGAADRPVETDGGNVNSPFEVVSEFEETRRDRYRKLYDAYVYAPVSIIWRDWRARIGLTIVVLYLLMGTVGTVLVEPTNVAEGSALINPFENAEYILGTDGHGRDLLSQTVHSTATILKMVVSGAVCTVGIGTTVGAIAGYKGGMVDTVLSSITDVFINIPGFPLVMVLGLMFDDIILGNPYAVGVLLSVAAWGGLARAIRSQMLTLREESFVEASQAMGMRTHTIVFKEIIPHLMPYVVINLTNAGRRVIFEAVALYYLGILPFENLNWGSTLNLAYQENAHVRPGALHWFLVPMVAIVFISVGLTLLGQSLDRVFNPRVRARHEKTTSPADPEGEPDDTTNANDMMGGI
ncbi:ABC transporter permease [Natrialba asiatica]|uniref:Binding-protein-dependent transport systems inner membrane component n=1 Tax=Natrialba asiatica (strain ATCC 700177 / DSM 12278 / JCM 9576 / FERM P-10747 / NBRC 102637 / 172P1) TaxID=29540 RepID=M0B3D2_NATA1|nr:ABC transporter permease [Natrialba asiatica]ELZ05416.1 binding-protein-dependent transport systems inner membrane component [Natrialba asiatica DSM 12278]